MPVPLQYLGILDWRNFVKAEPADTQHLAYDAATKGWQFVDGGGGFEVVGVPTPGQVPKWNAVTSSVGAGRRPDGHAGRLGPVRLGLY